jgi:glycerol-3-phosphate O-acyltransferase/dihydroxyacetone phosphate acyltransferase
MYALLRALAGVALRWYYRDIQVTGIERVPMHRPVLLVVNHPNALVDALLVGWVVPRRVMITAKSTLFKNVVASWLLRHLGVVPLYRAADVAGANVAARAANNHDTFAAVDSALAKGRCVLIFPEGKTHDEASLAPLKTGAARMALLAAEGVAPEIAILPIGLVFERKDTPRTRVLVQVGEPIVMSQWRAPTTSHASAVDALTRDIDTRLRAVTPNYASADDATRAVRLASMLAALLGGVPNIGVVDRRLGAEAAIARRIDDLSSHLLSADHSLRTEADQLAQRLDAIQRVASDHGVLLEDIGISLRPHAAVRFAIREGWLLVGGGPIALWGRINHWLPFRAARLVATRSIESAADPAMRTLVAGSCFVLLAYLVQTAIVGALWGPIAAFAYLVSLPVAADINFTLTDRLRRARGRATTYLRFRKDPMFQQRLRRDLDALRADVVALDRALTQPTLVDIR